jgi:isoleucyl-tRNA synthetase
MKSINPRPNFPEMEEEILKFWEEEKIFEKTLEQTKDGQPFVFFEGPPTANGKPGIHHVEARAFKDLFPRYQTMHGRFVMRKAGWDTHGLPVELQVEKALGVSGKKQIESIKPTVRESIIEFNRLCKNSVWQYKEEWENLTHRMGFWVDMKNPYVTYHNKYIESVWAILKEAWDKELVYKAHKVLPYCPRCGTALSSHEVALGYKTVKDNSVFIKFKLKDEPNTYVLSWTTTPWTLPGNVALAVGENIDYLKVNVNDEVWVVAKERAASVIPDASTAIDTAETLKGKDLVGKEYEPLFDVPFLKDPQSYKIYAADFVTTTDGTGVVHTAVMYGVEDYELGEKVGLPKKHTVDEDGSFVKEVDGLSGMYAKSNKAEKKIFDVLTENNNLIRVEPYEHEYPHCWRCDTALLYYARDSWFIRMSSLREDLIKNNEQIKWNPEYIKYGRFGQWLSDVKDWAISRERYWGTPLPIWQCTQCENIKVVGSVAELNLNKNKFYFARHGEAESNLQGIHVNYPEPTPIHLTPAGIAQAQLMAERIKDAGGVDLIFASDLTRTKETAEISSKLNGVEIIYDPRLREYNLGVLNGHKLEEFHQSFPAEKRWQTAPEGGETYLELQNRMLDFIAEINAKYNGKRILVVTHGDVIWLLNQYYDFHNHWPQVGEYTEVEIGLTDLHRPYIDEIKLPCEKCGSESVRVPAVADVWLDSGAMPFAQWHYPFENKELAEAQFPADFISEAIDQTRGWFYTLLAVSTLLGRGPAFKNVVCLGHLLDEKGFKMSKSKGNIVDPWTVAGKQGMDALRWYMYSVNQPGDSKLFTERDIDIIVRKNFLTLWNVLSFFVTYSSFENWQSDSLPTEELDVLDRWILVKTQELVNEVSISLDNYDAFKSTRKIEEFINELSTWYVRRSRERKGQALYQTLYHVLRTLSLLLAPFVPFLAESIWQILKRGKDYESVHLEQWPQSKPLTIEQNRILEQMNSVRKIVEVGLNKRKEANLKVRQPLASVSYKTNLGPLPAEYEKIILDELNIKIAKVIDGEKPQVNDPVIVEIDTNISAELKIEGYARELERKVQDMRKTTGLKVGEMVNLSYDTDDEDLKKALNLFDQKKTFVTEIKGEPVENMESLEVDGKTIKLGIQKA